MGVPKFFRYISERYPCLSELVKESQIPEFDNLYLDMNGIIHMCSHPDDYDPHFRISEERMFTDIFHYIEVLFRMIKPQKLFFMAVDGVAPRAKMNQQRGRRFRSAKEAEMLEAKAKDRGEELPAEARFDSNCITPGTVFMARLHEQLKYFVANKISTDKMWQKCKIILSGHETPGEGEHKIMDYIRYMKAQPGYNPNTRHCLYGLDADLMMLGLCTHEPHFSLLREEVRFGKKAKRKSIPEQITFFLLHLSLMREYLELEFLPIKTSLPFEYDLEKIIDDWVLMGFLVGNDFIPHLPNLHINSGALPVLYNAYMKILPTLDGYINEAGKLHLGRFEKFMAALGAVDMDNFSEQYADLKYFQSKTGRRPNDKERTSYKPKELEVWLPDDCDNVTVNDSVETKTANKDLEALIKSTDDLLLDDPFIKSDTTDDANTTEIKLLSNPELTVTAKIDDLLVELKSETESVVTENAETESVVTENTETSTNETLNPSLEDKVVEISSDVDKSSGDSKMLVEPSESNLADLALNDIELHDEDDEDALSPYFSESESDDELMTAEFIQHKNDYYMNKLDYSKVTPEVLRDQAEGYVRAIQWNLNYYYNGVCSWSWYYPHHYAPYISDIKDFADLKLEYDLGQPFKPFEQLLAVLPAASKTLLPTPYQELMLSENSPIIDYYPQDFRTDLNGKKQEWEAVVLIPFIAEDMLLKAMAPCNEKLSEDEAKRNSHGPMLMYEYTPEALEAYKAPEYFPTVDPCYAKLTPITIEEIRVDVDKLVKGPCPGSIHDVYYPGFPTFRHLKYTGELKKAKVKVFDSPSQNENMIVKITKSEDEVDIEELAKKILGTSVYVSWPHLIEAHVVSVSDAQCRYHKTSELGTFSLETNKGNLQALWYSQRNGIIIHCKEKLGIDVSETTILVHVKILVGTKYSYTQAGRVTLEKQWAHVESCYPLQAIVQNLEVHESLVTNYETIQELFPLGSKCFMIGHPHYGSLGEVIDNVSLKSGRIKVSMNVLQEPDLSNMQQYQHEVKYMPGGAAAQRLAITPHLLSRITGCIFVIPGVKGATVSKSTGRLNIGLNLKLNKKNEEIPGYSKKIEGQWLYSAKAVQLVRDYMQFSPDVFKYISSHMGNDVFYESELFPENIGEGKIAKIVEWIKKQPFSSIEHQKVGSKTVELEVVKKIEEIVDSCNAAQKNPKQVIMQVKPHLLFKPEIQSGQLSPDISTNYQLYDRVVNIREGYTVPFGNKGTVIGIESITTPGKTGEDDVEVMYDVVFDQPFVGGLQLNCSANRGYRLPKTALINISHGVRVVQQKTVNPATNNPWYGGASLNHQPQQGQKSQQHHQGTNPPVHSQNSAFASWTPPGPAYPVQHHQQHGMYGVPPIFRPNLPPFGHPGVNHHHRMPAPGLRMPHGQRPQQPMQHQQPQQEHAKNQGKGKQKSQNAIPNVPQMHMKNPHILGHTSPQVAQFNQGNLPTAPKSPGQQKPRQEGPSDETEALKKLLNISIKESPSNKQPLSSGDKNVAQQISVQDFFAHARNKEQKLAQSSSQSNTPFYSVQLLNYCQAQRIGIPRYSYFPSSDNKVRAQITLPDGRMVIGDESATKEEATENAAKIIITDSAKLKESPMMHNHHNVHAYAGPNIGPKGFPVPPKQWCQNQGQKQQRSHSKPNTKVVSNPAFQKQQPAPKSANGSRGNKNKDNVKSDENKPATSFVPLQAVKQHRHKSHSTSSDSSVTKQNKNGGGNTSGNNNGTKKSTSSPDKHGNSQSQTSVHPAPKQKTRRSRIAANFSGLQKQ